MVEITLIEIAQSTQDEGASAGRRPAKTLKPLFNRAAVKKSVAAAQPAVSTTATPTTAAPTTAVPQQEVPNKSAQPAPTTTPVPALPADATFNEENLTRAIKIFSQTLPHGGIRAQLFRLTPRLLGADSFEIEVDNPAIEAQMRQYLPQLTEYVKTALKMSSVRAVVKVAEFDPTIVLTNAQYYAKMKEKNPVLAILEKEMQLHL